MLAVYSLISLSVPQCKRNIIVTNESIVTSLASVKIVYQYIFLNFEYKENKHRTFCGGLL